MIKQVEEMNMEGKFALHLGCGKKILTGWMNIDLYEKHQCIWNYHLDDIPIKDETLDVCYSCHSLEHVWKEEGKSALKEWFRLLKTGGILYLSIPDVTEICKRFHERPEWYIQCLYGMQTDLGQVHCFGYTEETIVNVLLETGFNIQKLDRFNYGDTPSFYIEAIK